MSKLLTLIAGLSLTAPALVLAQSATRPATGPVAPATQPFANDLAKVSYSLGMKLARNVRKDLPDVDFDALYRGIRDAMFGEALLTDDQASQVLSSYAGKMQAKNDLRVQNPALYHLREGEAFLAKNAGAPGITVTPSGLQYRILKQGDGPIPKPGDIITVRYRGSFIDGMEFDSSHGKPAPFRVTGVIPGWTEALTHMPVGSKWQLFVPSDLAYGERGRDPLIPPNAVLTFELELVSIRLSEAPALPVAPEK